MNHSLPTADLHTHLKIIACAVAAVAAILLAISWGRPSEVELCF
jgi:hypothetical protein